VSRLTCRTPGLPYHRQSLLGFPAPVRHGLRGNLCRALWAAGLPGEHHFSGGPLSTPHTGRRGNGKDLPRLNLLPGKRYFTLGLALRAGPAIRRRHRAIAPRASRESVAGSGTLSKILMSDMSPV